MLERNLTFIKVSTASALTLLISSCGWSWEEKEALSPKFEYQVKVDPSQNDEFISLVLEHSDHRGLPEPIVRHFSGFGTTDIEIKSESNIIVVANAVDVSVYKARFYCNYIECDLNDLELLALSYMEATREKFKTSELERIAEPEPLTSAE